MVESGHHARDIRGGRTIGGALAQERVVARRVNRELVLVVDDDRLGHPLHVEDRHAIPANPRGIRFDDAKREGCGNGGIDDVASVCDGGCPGL
jgi:hypothetical protein